MIFPAFVPVLEEIFALGGFLGDPTLVFGVQEINLDPQVFGLRQRLKRLAAALASPDAKEGARRQLADFARALAGRRIEIPADYAASAHLGELLAKRGVRDVQTLDLFDSRATLRFDMNLPVPAEHVVRYHALLDLGCIEHVFDTRRCFENCVRMIRPGGFYFLHTPVSGFFRHGLHTFNPEALVSGMRLNGFEIVFHRYTSAAGIPLARPLPHDDVLIWLVGRKTRELSEFKIPQQGMWAEAY